MDSYAVWNDIKQQLKNKLDQSTYETYFDQINEVYKEINSTIYLVVNSMFVKTRIQNTYLAMLNDMLKLYYSEPRYFAFISKEEIAKEEEEKEREREIRNLPRINTSGLNPNYTFSTFIVGDSNRFAHRYATIAADQLSSAANPIYFFGDVGLGKTHLMQAIGNYLLGSKNLIVKYIRTQDFIEDYVKAAGKTDYDSFSLKYSSDEIDVLLVDDIQFLEGKPKCQIEFFKIFERLYNDKKLIVLTSDRKASDLQNIMTRLTSRFEWGIQLDINKPDKKHKIDIIKSKIKQELEDPSVINDETIEYIATVCENNIRELEGAVKRVLFYCQAFECGYTLDGAKEALKNFVVNADNQFDKTTSTQQVKKVIDVISSYFKITQDDLFSSSRKKEIVYARQICFYILKNKHNLTYQKIGDLFNGKDHSTIMHGCEVIENLIKIEEETQKNVDNIERKLGKNPNEI